MSSSDESEDKSIIDSSDSEEESEELVQDAQVGSKRKKAQTNDEMAGKKIHWRIGQKNNKVWNVPLVTCLLKVACTQSELFKTKKHDKLWDHIAKLFFKQPEIKELKAEKIKGL
jgi:hypothetical protein